MSRYLLDTNAVGDLAACQAVLATNRWLASIHVRPTLQEQASRLILPVSHG